MVNMDHLSMCFFLLFVVYMYSLAVSFFLFSFLVCLGLSLALVVM